MKRAIIFLNGDLSNFKNAKQYIKSTDLIICADGAAYSALNLNIIPNAIVGDFDSLSKSIQQKLRPKDDRPLDEKKHPVKFIRFAREKDESDSELAMDYAVRQGCKEILIFGLLGSRLDHLFSNIFHLEIIAKKAVDIKIIEGNQEVFVANKKITIKGKIGDFISLLPLSADAKSVLTEGLKYKLSNEDLLFGYSRGISNIMTQKEAEISLESGTLLVVHTKK
jgi:thiamine pyrophosphokinase